jgi:ABC-type uncharacterized transport system substrate-binding protein
MKKLNDLQAVSMPMLPHQLNDDDAKVLGATIRAHRAKRLAEQRNVPSSNKGFIVIEATRENLKLIRQTFVEKNEITLVKVIAGKKTTPLYTITDSAKPKRRSSVSHRAVQTKRAVHRKKPDLSRPV